MTQPSHYDIQRDLGRVEGRQAAMGAQLEKLEKAVDEGFREVTESLEAINARLGKIETAETERKGAWKAIAALAAFVAGIVGWLAERFF